METARFGHLVMVIGDCNYVMMHTLCVGLFLMVVTKLINIYIYIYIYRERERERERERGNLGITLGYMIWLQH